ncbi:MAG: hypothetical protein PHS60_15215, partial [Zavarzinia sp.]|nr:hypothetical protein [Zavarzinia sp.]
ETVGKGIADGIARRLDGTSRDAERAAARLEAAAEALGWKRFLAGAAGGLGVVLAAILAAWWILPSAADIRALTAERDHLAAVVADLEKRGGRADVTTCGNRGERGRLCVRVDPSAGRYGEGNDYMIIRGY